MAYDEELVERIRAIIAPVGSVGSISEKRMFGGLAFLLDGHITVAASGKGGLMCHVDPDEAPELCAAPGVERMEMNGRVMDAWLRVDAGEVADDAALAAWVDRGVIAAKLQG